MKYLVAWRYGLAKPEHGQVPEPIPVNGLVYLAKSQAKIFSTSLSSPCILLHVLLHLKLYDCSEVGKTHTVSFTPYV